MGLVAAAVAVAFEGGGRKPSEAPLIAFGQHYAGKLNNQQADANFEGEEEVAFYRLPPVGTRDTVTVNWHVLPFTDRSGEFPICMALLQGIDDFSWGSVFGRLEDPAGIFTCSSVGPEYRVSGSGSSQTTITVQNADASSSYLIFYANADETDPLDFETYPYDFSVEAPRRYLGLALKPKKRVFANGAIGGAVTLADGLPAPDGIPFSLTVNWGRSGTAIYGAATAGGSIVFPLALPEDAVGERAKFTVSHGADAGFQGVSAELGAVVQPAQLTAAQIACNKAVQKAHTTSRQLRRLKKNAGRAQGAAKRKLKRKARKVRRKLKAAQGKVRATCPR